MMLTLVHYVLYSVYAMLIHNDKNHLTTVNDSKGHVPLNGSYLLSKFLIGQCLAVSGNWTNHRPAKCLCTFLIGSHSHCRFLIGQYVAVHGEVISHVNISRAQVEDGGLYTCIAENRAGRAEHSARLNIYGKQ